MSSMAHKVVMDSAPMPDAASALRVLADLARGPALIADLAWTRTTRWRAILSQVFENREYLAKLPSIREIRISFRKGLETTARYMGAWLSNSLNDSGIEATLTLTPQPDAGPSRVELIGDNLRVCLERRNGKLTATVNDLSTCIPLPQLTDFLLMREELGIMRRDTIYERALASACNLPGPLLPASKS